MRLKLIMFLICILVVVGCRRSETGQGTTNTQTTTPEQTSQTSPTPATSPVTQTAQPSPPTGDSTNTKPKVDACAMLTSKDIEPIQGEAIKETKLSGSSTGGFNVSQCFFTLPTFTNSVSLAVTQRGDGPGARDPRQFWKDTFHREEREKGGKREKDREKEREGEEEEESPPQKVTGIGEEAFWTASRVAGALYVLKGNNYVRVSVGGGGDQQSKLRKSKALARKVLERL